MRKIIIFILIYITIVISINSIFYFMFNRENKINDIDTEIKYVEVEYETEIDLYNLKCGIQKMKDVLNVIQNDN